MDERGRHDDERDQRQRGPRAAHVAERPRRERQQQRGVEQQHRRPEQDHDPDPLVDPAVGDEDAGQRRQPLADPVGGDGHAQVDVHASGTPASGNTAKIAISASGRADDRQRLASRPGPRRPRARARSAPARCRRAPRASASSPSSRPVGAGFISVPQRSTPYSPSAPNATSLITGRSCGLGDSARASGPASLRTGASTATWVVDAHAARSLTPAAGADDEADAARHLEAGPVTRLGRQRLRNHQDRGSDAGARQPGGQPVVRRRRDVQDLGRPGARGRVREPASRGRPRPARAGRGRPATRSGRARPRAGGTRPGSSRPQPVRRAELEHERGGGAHRRVEVLGRVRRRGRRARPAGASRCRRAAGARAVRRRARAPASGSGRPACPAGRAAGRRPRWRRTARAGPRRWPAATSRRAARNPPHPLGARQHEQLLRRRRGSRARCARARAGRETISVGGSRRLQPAPREARRRSGRWRSCPPEIDRHRSRGSRPARRRADRSRPPPGSPSGPRRTSIVASIGSLLDDPLGVERALDARAAGGEHDPRRRDRRRAG